MRCSVAYKGDGLSTLLPVNVSTVPNREHENQ